MKKDSSPVITDKADGKGMFYQAGEIIGSIGFHIVDGKDRVIGAIKKKLGKKQTSESKEKKVSKKKSGAKAGKKITGTIKKPAKKSNPAKAVRKKVIKGKKPSAKNEDIPPVK